MAKQYKIYRSNDHDLRRQISDGLNDMMQLDSGNGGTGFPDGQVLTGNQYLYDSAAQQGNFIWTQEAAAAEFGGFLVVDFDPTQGVPPAVEDTVAVYGLSPDPDQAGVKKVGILFPNVQYSPTFTTAPDVNSNLKVQTLNLPNGPAVPGWQWPNTDGPPGATLTSDGSGGLYWTDPPNEPNLVLDTNTTDFEMTDSPGWSTVPVTVTATQNSTPAQLALDISFWTGSNGQSVTTRMLVDGVQSGQAYTIALPRNSILYEHYVWSPIVLTGQVVTVEVQSDGGKACWVYGATGEPTELTMLEPGGNTVLAANVQGTANVISPDEFWNRWTDPALVKLAKVLNRTNIGGGPPSWLSVARVTVFVAKYSANNVDLLNPVTVNNINELVSLNVLSAAEAAIILAT